MTDAPPVFRLSGTITAQVITELQNGSYDQQADVPF